MFPTQVFLDEVNTSSCMGLLKEIIIDKTFDGEVHVLQFIEILHILLFCF